LEFQIIGDRVHNHSAREFADEDYSQIPGLSVEIFVEPGRPNVNKEDVTIRFGVSFFYLHGLFKGGGAANRGTVREVPLVSAARTLYKAYVLRVW
jgi:hypothetical protein